MLKKKVVVIGGGNGSALALQALKPTIEQFELSAVISMSDSGGSSGQLRAELGALPPGDILRAIIALSKYDYALMRQIFYTKRFTGGGKLTRHNVGNIFLALGTQYSGDFMETVRALENALDAVGLAYPVTLELSTLCVELSDGSIIRSEGEIDRPMYDRKLKIKRAWLESSPAIYPEAEQALLKSDYIILSPGSLYTSVVATLLPAGVKEAINQSQAKLVGIIANGYELEGENGPERLSEYVRELEIYLPRPFDVIVYNNHKLDDIQQRYYIEKKWRVFEKDVENIIGRKIVGADFEASEGGVSSDKLGKIFTEIVK